MSLPPPKSIHFERRKGITNFRLGSNAKDTSDFIAEHLFAHYEDVDIDRPAEFAWIQKTRVVSNCFWSANRNELSMV